MQVQAIWLLLEELRLLRQIQAFRRIVTVMGFLMRKFHCIVLVATAPTPLEEGRLYTLRGEVEHSMGK